MSCTDTARVVDRSYAPTRSESETRRRGFTGLMRHLATWQERAITRAHLAALDPRLRRDIGLTDADIAEEINKPFWRP